MRRGGSFDIFGRETVAGSGKIHDQVLSVPALPNGIPKRYRPPLRRP